MMKIDASNGETFSIPGYTHGFMLDGFVDEDSHYPANATVQLNNQLMTLRRLSKNVHTTRTGTLNPVTSTTNTVTVTGSGLVDLVFWGGSL